MSEELLVNITPMETRVAVVFFFPKAFTPG